jgi:hypothetical protein
VRVRGLWLWGGEREVGGRRKEGEKRIIKHLKYRPGQSR